LKLYKLYSVGEKFGRCYCNKIIVATDINFALSDAKNIILQKASDMGIKIVSDVHRMPDDELLSVLRITHIF
jgi:hypothetical protein